MFTDDAVTPVRLEILVDLLCRRSLGREELYSLLQPKALEPNAQSIPAKATLRAALELGLAVEEGDSVSVAVPTKREKNTQVAILKAFDENVLSHSGVEKYFALFYAYFLHVGKGVYTRSGKYDDWAAQFNKDVFADEPQANPFNAEKLTGLHRWFSYVGLGWYDPAENFQANPYQRILRVLPKIFGKHRKLKSEDFMQSIGTICPELDGGQIFQQANRNWKIEDKQCSLGLSHALIELHEDNVLRLDCPADCQDWSLREAEPPRDDSFKGDRFALVEWRKD